MTDEKAAVEAEMRRWRPRWSRRGFLYLASMGSIGASLAVRDHVIVSASSKRVLVADPARTVMSLVDAGGHILPLKFVGQRLVNGQVWDVITGMYYGEISDEPTERAVLL
jgi:hypothetical protein